MLALASSATGATLGPPDGRGYELVSPVANADGDVYEPTLEGVNGAGGAGYNTERPFQAAAGGGAVAYVGDPSAEGGTASEGRGAGNEYLATRAPGGGWTALNIEPSSGSLAEESVYQAFSSSLSVGILDWDGSAPLSDGAPGGGYQVLYARTVADGAYRPLFTTTPPNRTPEQLKAVFAGASANFEHLLFTANDALTPPAEEAPPSVQQNDLYDSVGGRLSLVNVLPEGKADPNAAFSLWPISADGSRIFWTDLNTGELYVRENGATTVKVAAGAAQLWTATPDGRYAYYTEAEKLYRFDVETEERDQLAGAGVEGVVGVNEEGEDGSYLYYVASDHLYFLHQGEAPHLIAQLSPADEGDWSAGLANRTAEVTPDGLHLVFVSHRSLTGYENAGLSEVYLYDAASRSQAQALTCVSCDPSGRPPSVGSEYSALLQPGHSDTRLPRWISGDANRVFFDSADALVPQDDNRRLDVYEWERDGAGSCTQAQGCIYLLSGGVGTDNSYFVDASSSGNDVFIVTREQLAPQDQNERFDLYDARVGASPQPLAPTACNGSGCQGLPTAALELPPAATMTFEGIGNFPPPAPASALAKHARHKPSHRHKKKSKHVKRRARSRKARRR